MTGIYKLLILLLMKSGISLSAKHYVPVATILITGQRTVALSPNIKHTLHTGNTLVQFFRAINLIVA